MGLDRRLAEREITFSPISAPVILPRTEVVDIDTPEDWDVAELTYKVLKSRA